MPLSEKTIPEGREIFQKGAHFTKSRQTSIFISDEMLETVRVNKVNNISNFISKINNAN